MKKGPLIVLLCFCIILVVGLNLQYLQKVAQQTNPLYDTEIDGKPRSSIEEHLQTFHARKKKIKKEKTKSHKKKKGTADAQNIKDDAAGAGHHAVAGLNCEKYGGPSSAIAQEMIYWQDIPSDASYVSPYARYGYTRKYLTFEPDEGGWNNIRMSMETATVMALAMGRVLVLPPEQQMYLLWNGKNKEHNQFTFKDFFHFDSIAMEHPAVQVISMEQFLKEKALTGRLKDRHGKVTFPPNNQTKFEFGRPREAKNFFHWLRNATSAPLWDYEKCVVGFAETPGSDGTASMNEFYEFVKGLKSWYTNEYIDNPTPVDANSKERLREQLGDRRKLCVYGDRLQKVPVIHFMGDNNSGARLLTHFYVFLFFENYHQDLWIKRFVRDHLRYIDEIQCAAARVVHQVRTKAIENGNPDGIYDSFHIRRGDFQYKETRIDANQIYENVKDVLVKNSTIFIATDERDLTFFEPLRQHYHVYFLHDFQDVLSDLNKNFYGMLDQRIASRGQTFVGSYFSTFTGYINRMRGYHSQKDKLPGYENGELFNTYYYVPTKNKDVMRVYHSVKAPFWAREFPVGWRDIDHDLSD